MAIALVMMFGGVRPAAAQMQQGLANPPPPPSQPLPLVIPHSQGKTDSTLELPSMPAKQGADSLNIPPRFRRAARSWCCRRASCASSRVTSKSP